MLHDPINQLACAIGADTSKPGVRVTAGHCVYSLPGTTVATGPAPDGGCMVADLSRFSAGDRVQIHTEGGMRYAATVGG